MTEKVCRDKASWALCRNRLFLFATGCTGQAHEQTCVCATGLRGRLGRTHDSVARECDIFSQPHVTTGFLCRNRVRAGDSCHGRVSGINKICFLCSSYCRSQAAAA